MVSTLALLPLVVALALGGVLIVAKTSRRVEVVLTSLALNVFGPFVDEDAVERKRLMQSACVAQTYRVYATTTYLYAVVLTVVGGIVVGYLAGGFMVAVPVIGELLSGLPRTITAALGNPATWELSLSPAVFYGVAVGSGLVGGLIVGVATYSLRWQLLQGRAEARRRRINESLPRTVAFLYALSRGGMPFPKVMETLAENRRTYGETAEEVSVAVREMTLFGTDMINAIQRTAQRSPSEEFKTFGENLASVLQSGQNLPRFLSEQYERYQEEARERQEEVLELLATLAEAYVTVFVAGTLFLVTILFVFGLTTTDTLWIIRLLAYVVIPLASVGFMVFLDQQLELLGIGDDSDVTVPDLDSLVASADRTTSDVRAADGGHVPALTANLERLAVYDRVGRYRDRLGNPVRAILRNPTALLYVTVPIAVLVTAVRLPGAFTGVGVNLRALDDMLVQAALFVMGSYAIVRYLHTRRLGRIEAATPEFLDRLASLNEAGMSVVESFNRVRGSDLGALSTEVERIWADVRLGANVEEALLRFGDRVRTTPVTRAVTLLTNAMRASGNIGTVLRIAADQSRSDLRMKRQRRRQMLTYLIVIYVSFAVFLVIIIAVQEVLVPSLPDAVPTPPSDNRLGVDAAQFTRFGDVNKAAYTLVFFHTALIQAVLSGLIGGQIGEGSIKDGVKHATVMLGIAYVIFTLLTSPVAYISVTEPAAGDELVIESAELSEGGYIVLHQHGPDGEVIGQTAYLPAGRSEDITVQLDREVTAGTTVYAVPHVDSDGNEQFDYDGGERDAPYPPGREDVATRIDIREPTVTFEPEE